MDKLHNCDLMEYHFGSSYLFEVSVVILHVAYILTGFSSVYF